MQFYVVFPLLLALVRRTGGHHVALVVVSLVLQGVIVGLMHWRVLPSGHARVLGHPGDRLLPVLPGRRHGGGPPHGRGSPVDLRPRAGAAGRHRRSPRPSPRGGSSWRPSDVAPWLGSSSDPLQPIVIPFNIGAIACIYLVGVYLVDRRRPTTVRAMIRSGSDDSYGVYLAQMVFITVLTWIGYRRLDHVLPWPVVCVVALVLVFGGCVLLTERVGPHAAVGRRSPGAGDSAGRPGCPNRGVAGPSPRRSWRWRPPSRRRSIRIPPGGERARGAGRGTDVARDAGDGIGGVG